MLAASGERDMRKIGLGFVLAGMALTVAAQIPEGVDPIAIPNYRVVKPGFATAGQPTPEALRSLKEKGFKTVINLRMDTEPGVKEEEAAVKEQGLNYVWVPFTAATFSQEKVDQVRHALEDPRSGAVLLHCASANRVGAVWTVIEAQRGKSYEEALAAGKAIGLSSPPMIEAVDKLLGRSK
jgi:uncharacterized protein (TIGR01244 family)